MASKKKLPWRTLVEIGDDQYGRFTREQIREAVRAVKAEREARGGGLEQAPPNGTIAAEPVEPRTCASRTTA